MEDCFSKIVRQILPSEPLSEASPSGYAARCVVTVTISPKEWRRTPIDANIELRIQNVCQETRCGEGRDGEDGSIQDGSIQDGGIQEGGINDGNIQYRSVHDAGDAADRNALIEYTRRGNTNYVVYRSWYHRCFICRLQQICNTPPLMSSMVI